MNLWQCLTMLLVTGMKIGWQYGWGTPLYNWWGYPGGICRNIWLKPMEQTRNLNSAEIMVDVYALIVLIVTLLHLFIIALRCITNSILYGFIGLTNIIMSNITKNGWSHNLNGIGRICMCPLCAYRASRLIIHAPIIHRKPFKKVWLEPRNLHMLAT